MSLLQAVVQGKGSLSVLIRVVIFSVLEPAKNLRSPQVTSLILALLHAKIDRHASTVFALACVHSDLGLARAALSNFYTALTVHPKPDPFGPGPHRTAFGISRTLFGLIPPACVFNLLQSVQQALHVAPRDAPELCRRLSETFTVSSPHRRQQTIATS